MKSLVLAAALTLGLAAPAAATPEPPCGKTAEIAKHLADKYHEVPVAFGLQSNGHLLQFYASPETETWTVVNAMPNGTACILSTGTGWGTREPLPTGPKV